MLSGLFGYLAAGISCGLTFLQACSQYAASIVVCLNVTCQIKRGQSNPEKR